MVFRNTELSQDFLIFPFESFCQHLLEHLMNVWQKKHELSKFCAQKEIWHFFVLIWHCQFFYIRKDFKTCISVWVFELVKITGGPIISGPFHKDRETYITIRRLRYNMPTLVNIFKGLTISYGSGLTKSVPASLWIH